MNGQRQVIRTAGHAELALLIAHPPRDDRVRAGEGQLLRENARITLTIRARITGDHVIGGRYERYERAQIAGRDVHLNIQHVTRIALELPQLLVHRVGDLAVNGAARLDRSGGCR